MREPIFTGPAQLVNATKTRQIRFPAFKTVFGVDYSGAAQAGRNAWLAELSCEQPFIATDREPPFQLITLAPLERLAGASERDTVNRYLAERIVQSSGAFWGFDFPFGLPIELNLGRWTDQVELATHYAGNAKEFGRMLVEKTEQRLGSKHVRRATDKETQTPFDCYHYRIIYQTFHGMRDVLGSIHHNSRVCVLPFQYQKLVGNKTAGVVVEACPSSTLKRLGLPFKNYKQSGNKPPEKKHQRNRREILQTLDAFVEISPHRRRVMMSNPGGDALDAVLAAVGSWQGFVDTEHVAVASDDRYPHEGRVYC
ncbi:MAG: DUF429 domain-containing protein [Planctomycetota bacterium]